MKKLLLLLSLITISLHAEEVATYNRMIEPVFPEYTSVDRFELLPQQERHLITVALYDFYTEMENFASRFLPAITDTLNQKTFLEMELKKIDVDSVNPDILVRKQALETVLKEKDTMLNNLEAIQLDQEKKLYNELKLRVSKVLTEWSRANPKQADSLLAQ